MDFLQSDLISKLQYSVHLSFNKTINGGNSYSGKIEQKLKRFL